MLGLMPNAAPARLLKLDRYSKLAGDAIGQSMCRQRLAPTLVRRQDVARSITLIYWLEDDSGRAVESALRLKTVFKSAIVRVAYDLEDDEDDIAAWLIAAADQLRLYEASGFFCVDLRHPKPGRLLGTRLQGRGLAVPLGIAPARLATAKDPRRAIVGIDLANPATPHVKWIGTTGSGKTTGMRLMAHHLISQLREQVVVTAITGRSDDWSALDGCPYSYGMVMRPDAPAALRWLRAEVDRRERTGDRLPHQVWFIDDLAALLLDDRSVAASLAYIASQGRARNIHLVIGSQAATAEAAGGGLILENIGCSVTMRVTDAHSAARAAGRGRSQAEQLPGSGSAVLTIPGQEKVNLVIGSVTNTDLSLMLADLGITGAHHLPRPWPTVSPPVTGEPASDEAAFVAPGAANAGATVTSEPGDGGDKPFSWPRFEWRKAGPTDEETDAIQALLDAGHSLNAIMDGIYGNGKPGSGKSGPRNALVNEALARRKGERHAIAS